jgi:glycosyltransferase involved in cell wall biosynthesis
MNPQHRSRGRAPRRILLIEINEDGTVGGSYRCLFDLVRGMDRHRFTPVVLFYENNVYVDRLRALGIATHAWDAERLLERNDRFRSSIARRLFTRWSAGAAVLRRVRFLRRERIDLVHLNNTPCIGFSDWLPAARLLRIPCIAHARGAYVRPGSGVGRWLTRRFDRVIAISRHIADNMETAGIPAQRITQIYDGIALGEWGDQLRAEPGQVRRSVGVPSSVLLVTMVGHLRWWKGQDVLLSALAKLAPAVRARLHVLVVGGAPQSDAAYQEQLRLTVQEEHLESCVTFLGDRDDVRELMNASDVVVHASTVPEPFGLVVLEGMALGKAVVASRLGGPAEIVTEASGMLFDPKRPQELASLLVALAEDPDRRRALGAAARHRAAAFDVRLNIAGIESLYAELLGETAHGSVASAHSGGDGAPPVEEGRRR